MVQTMPRPRHGSLSREATEAIRHRFRPHTRFNIADHRGMAPETVARGVARLERKNLVKRTSSRRIRVLNMDGLHQMQNRGRGPSA